MMKTKEMRAREFLTELHALLQKHKVEISLEEESSSYYHCTKQMVATMQGVYHTETYEYLEEYTTIELGSWLEPSMPEEEFIGCRSIGGL